MRLFVISLLVVSFVSFTRPASRSQSKQSLMPSINFIAEATVRRISDRKDRHGSHLSPWREVGVSSFFTKVKPAVGSQVTVIPLGVSLASFDLTIVKAERQPSGCDGSETNAWEVELEPVTDKRFFEIPPLPNRRDEVPFDVCVIYPAVATTRQLQKGQLTHSVLPRGVSINTVKAAIDVTNDRRPDVIIAEFCCNDPSKSEGCDYTCGKTFKKTQGKWKLVDEYAPC